MSPSIAPTITPAASTWRRPFTRRRSWRPGMPAGRSPTPSASRSGCAPRPSSASRAQNGSRRWRSPTPIPAETGKTAALAVSAAVDGAAGQCGAWGAGGGGGLDGYGSGVDPPPVSGAPARPVGGTGFGGGGLQRGGLAGFAAERFHVSDGGGFRRSRRDRFAGFALAWGGTTLGVGGRHAGPRLRRHRRSIAGAGPSRGDPAEGGGAWRDPGDADLRPFQDRRHR